MLCAALLVWQPVSLALTAPRTVDALAIHGTPLALVLAAQVVAAGCGIAAGISIVQRAGIALTLTRSALTLSAALDVFVSATSFVPNNRMPGDAPLYIGVTLTTYTLWMVYLARSKRVRDTLC